MKIITYTNTDTTIPESATPQIKQLITALRSMFGKDEFNLSRMTGLTEHGLKTRQDPARIFAYYQTDMLDLGLISKCVTVTETEKKNVSRIEQIRALAREITENMFAPLAVHDRATAILDLLK